MPTVSDIAAAIAARTNPEQTPDWDPAGLQLGDPSNEVASVGVCHEVNETVVKKVEEAPVDLLVTYHPLLFSPTTAVVAGKSPGARSYRLIRAGVDLLVTHTDFFDLRDVESFGADEDSGLPEIGRFGGFSGSLATVDAMLTDAFGPVGMRVSGDRERNVEKLAVVPGSGSSLIEVAARVADVLVTGDVSHHRTVAARDLGLDVVDPGHTATERPGMRSLVELVSEVSGVEVVDLTGIDPQTWD